MPATSILLRLPPALAGEASAQAEAAGISRNAWLTLAVRNWVSYKRREFQQVAARPVDHRRRLPAPQQAVSGKEPEAGRPAASLSRASPALPKAGRNDPCPCGSGLKYKRCHGLRTAPAA